MNRGSNGAGSSTYNGPSNYNGGGGPTSLLIDGSRLQEHWWLLP